MALYRTARMVLFDGSSAASSTYTSPWFMVDDFRQLSLSWTTATTASSRLTLVTSADDGLRSSIASTSVLSTVLSRGIFTVEPGIRWIRAVRASNESLGNAVLIART